jgi:hypothetical protein
MSYLQPEQNAGQLFTANQRKMPYSTTQMPLLAGEIKGH